MTLTVNDDNYDGDDDDDYDDDDDDDGDDKLLGCLLACLAG